MRELLIALIIALQAHVGTVDKGYSDLNQYPLVGCSVSSEYCFYDMPIIIPVGY